MTSAAGTISVVLVSWNAAEVIAPCLDSLHGQADEVLLVDNASADGTAALVEARFPWVRVYRQSRNLGFAGGVNVGVRRSHGRLVLLLNCDTIARPGAIARLAEVLCATKRCGAVGGTLIGADGTPQHGFHARRFPTLWTWAVDLLLLDHLWPDNPVTRRYLARDVTAGAHQPVEVDQPAAACLMVHRQTFQELGGMDERFYPAWFEDVDFCRRMRASGHRLFFVPDALFTHRGGVAMQALGPTAFSRHWYRNLTRYLDKHHGTTGRLLGRLLIVCGMGLRLTLSGLQGQWRQAAGYGRVAAEAIGFGGDADERDD